MTAEDRARSFVDLLAASRFAEAVSRFDTTMKEVLPASKLEETWRSLLGQVGPFQSVTGARRIPSKGREIVLVTCAFEKASLDAKVVFNPDHTITGLFFVPVEPATAEWKPPAYVQEDDFAEHDISIGAGDWRLPGTLSLPSGEGPFPAVILVHGSGPHDRDETIGPNKPFRDLAWGLASRGIAVVRYEKRTKAHAARLAAVRDFTVQEEVIDDALAAATATPDTARIDPRRVFILGHSLGGYLAPRILAADRAIAGAILLAGSSRPMETLILEQVDYLARVDGTVSAEETAKLAEIKADLAKLTDPTFSRASPPVFGVPASYWLDLRAYDPLATAKRLERPLLILQGGRDYQVTRADFELWERGLEGARASRLQLYPELNHLFVPGTGNSTPDEYAKGGHVAPQVIDDIATWISSLSPP